MKPLDLMLRRLWSIYVHVFPLFLVTASAAGNETDQLALLKFKETITKDEFKILSSWNTSIHFCNWAGITCSSQNQRVTALDLNSSGLYGLISPYIGNLTFLRHINLQNNSLSGGIPEELGRLPLLHELYLTNNTLGGEIPTSLANCSQLMSLDLRGTALFGKIPVELGSLRKLQQMTLAVNNLTGEIPATIGNLSSLNSLSVGMNNLHGKVPEELGRLKNLIRISIASNKLSGNLPASLFNISSLTLFSAGDNKFTGSLPSNLGLTLPNLQQFGVGMNQMSGKIPPSISNATRLQLFNVPQNNFVGPVPTNLGNLEAMWSLAMERNNLGSNSSGDLDFLTSLANCSKLVVLDLNLNNFGGPLPHSIANLSTQITQLYIGGNQIYGNIPEGLGNLINLFALDLEVNNFTGVIPSSFGNFKNMQSLTLNVNKLSGHIPYSLGNLSQLFQLDLSQNMLEGNIPPSLGNCRNLQYLDISQNNLNGSIPPQVIGLSSFSLLLNFSKNSLTGSLPVEISNLQSLNKMDISENFLSGEIPSTIGDCISLEYLSLRGNAFQGIIPPTIASLKALRHLDLSQNKLTGQIPAGLENISVLEFLNLSSNTLGGAVPTTGIFRNATAISLSNSGLCGGVSELHLPPCSSSVTKQTKASTVRLIVVIICPVIFLLGLFFLVIYWKKKNRNSESSSSVSSAIEHFPKVSYQTIHRATDGFSRSNLIGSGSFGSVYKGNLETEQRVVAIKVLHLEKKGAHKSFLAECNALRNIRHRNLVKILTCCSSNDYKGNEFKGLVFEYLENGNLEQWLHPEMEIGNESINLDLLQRLNILIDVASALHYLHEGCEQPIVHCDLKPSNILLDDDMVAHVGDFGLARLVSTINQKQTSTTCLKGTVGYAPPEYGVGGAVWPQGDVYSFGILVFEILTGKKPTDEMFKDGLSLHRYVKSAMTKNIRQIVDPVLLAAQSQAVIEVGACVEDPLNAVKDENVFGMVEKCLVSLLRIGLDCSAESPRERIKMGRVVKELSLVRDAFLTNENDGQTNS